MKRKFNHYLITFHHEALKLNSGNILTLSTYIIESTHNFMKKYFTSFNKMKEISREILKANGHLRQMYFNIRQIYLRQTFFKTNKFNPCSDFKTSGIS